VAIDQQSTQGSSLHIRATLGPKLPWMTVIGVLVMVGGFVTVLALDGMSSMGGSPSDRGMGRSLHHSGLHGWAVV